MRIILLRTLLLAMVILLNSCSPEEPAGSPTVTEQVKDYNYNPIELNLVEAINEYRESIGLNRLETIDHVSFKSGEHNQYMITNKVVNHDKFEQRSQNIMDVLGAVKVNENIAYNYTTPAGAMHAWLESAGHKANIEGDFTHFGVSVTEDPLTGKKYYTNIFIKIN